MFITFLLVTEHFHRCVVALLGALLTILIGVGYGLFDAHNLWDGFLVFVDINAILLIIGIMIMAEAATELGAFNFIALSLVKAIGFSL